MSEQYRPAAWRIAVGFGAASILGVGLAACGDGNGSNAEDVTTTIPVETTADATTTELATTTTYLNTTTTRSTTTTLAPTTTTDNAAAREAIAAAFTIDPTTVTDTCVDLAKKVDPKLVINIEPDKSKPAIEALPLHVGALQPVGNGPDQRRWSDAISTPLSEDGKTDDVAKMLGSYKIKLCEDPLLLGDIDQRLANLTVDGKRLVELNPWLKHFDVPVEQINMVAQQLVPIVDAKDGISPEELQRIQNVTAERMRLASMTITLLGRFATEQNVQTRRTSANNHLADAGLVVSLDKLPGLANNEQYEGDFITFKATFKGLKKCIAGFGVNPGDARSAILEGNECEQPPVTPPETTQPGTTVERSTTTHPNTTTVKTVPPKKARPPVTGGVDTTIGNDDPHDSTPTTRVVPTTVLPTSTTATLPPTSEPGGVCTTC